MKYLKVVQGVATVLSGDGRSVTCNYLEHPRFSYDCNFSAGLHYAFVRFVQDRSYSKGYEIRKAINVFLDFICVYESGVPDALHLNSLDKITSEVFYGFDQYAKKVKAPQGLASRLRGALTSVAKDYDEGMPLLFLPAVDSRSGKPAEPLTEACFVQLSTALKQHIDSLYEKLTYREKLGAVTPYPRSELLPFDGKVSRWVPDDDRALKTLLLEGHPLAVPFDDFQHAYDSARSARSTDALSNPCEFIYRRYLIHAVRPTDYADAVTPLDDVFARYFPTAMDQVAIALFIGLQTGWNKETVSALDSGNYEHALAGILNDKNALIFSEKNKSQGRGKPYKDPKAFYAASSKEDRYSAYNLIQLAKKLSEPMLGLPIDHIGREYCTINPLFSCIRGTRQMSNDLKKNQKGNLSRPGRYTSATVKDVWSSGVKAFFKKYEVCENGNRLETAKDIALRLRPTWVRFVRDKRGTPLSVVALTQGHKDIESTDIHYDDSGMARQQRRERLRKELTLLMSKIRQNKFKGLIGKRGDTSINFASLRVFSLPGQDRSLWACSDSYKPDWPGSSTQIPIGKKCSELRKCLFCSQVCIFEDSLPYLMDRQASLQREAEEIGAAMLDPLHADELSIIEYIFDVWGDEEALKNAARYLRKNPSLLPSDMSILSVLFEDDE
ncbi:hypothetical protein [Congregibacter litoralis]|uniref:Integrase n=1 Tax=Congregibacter litoralis KT71 TaxID=314285 RepID=A4A8F6_9GAMM|nr:hypothetical protein [Congregibacter litoralis]EAQ97951.1 hypothetical protein KT71_15339 [Congregibacter litoralis KT71]